MEKDTSECTPSGGGYCGSSNSRAELLSGEGAGFVDGHVPVPGGGVPRVQTDLNWRDCFGSWKARWGIGRMRYRVGPGLYAVGSPTRESPVLVTANYKMTFDRLRSHLGGTDAWILVLDTDGINVWCAAGGGKFSVGELTDQMKAVRLSEIVSHRRIVLPQLAAPGVASHEVERLSGFRVVYGPVRASDIPAFLNAGMKATKEMRQVTFDAAERAVLIPMELVLAGRYALPVALAMFFLSGIRSGTFSMHGVYSEGWVSVILVLVGYLGGALLTPLALPFVPGRAFSLKGAITGAVLAASCLTFLWKNFDLFPSWPVVISWLCIIPAVSSYLAMNFTGSTPYTSLSGVRRELKIALPVQAALSAAGLVMWLAGRFV